MIPLEKPGTPKELVHHGIKGMHWGIRKTEEKVADHNERSKLYINALPKKHTVSPKEAQKNLAENQSKFIDKFQSSDHTLTPKEKKILVVAGVGLGAIALAGGGYYAYREFGGKSLVKSDSEIYDAYNSIRARGKKLPADPRALAGKHVDAETFKTLSYESTLRTWSAGEGYIKPSSFARPAFELPVGHTFSRVSWDAEHSFSPVTYATHTFEDRNRYLFGNRHAGHLISFKSKETIKIPHITEVLDTLKGVMEESSGTKVSDSMVIKEYQHISGSSWNFPTATKLIEGLQNKGFHGVVDEMDAGVYGDSPIVLFGKNFTPKVSQKMTDDTFNAAEKNLTELVSRKL